MEIGWTFRRAVWGRGYATEIGRFGLDHAFSVADVEEVVSFTEVHNARARLASPESVPSAIGESQRERLR